MALTVRLSPQTERVLDELVRRRRQTRSDVVREAIEQYTTSNATTSPENSALAAWVDVIGVVDSGTRPSGKTTGERFTELVSRKAHARRPR